VSRPDEPRCPSKLSRGMRLAVVVSGALGGGLLAGVSLGGDWELNVVCADNGILFGVGRVVAMGCEARQASVPSLVVCMALAFGVAYSTLSPLALTKILFPLGLGDPARSWAGQGGGEGGGVGGRGGGGRAGRGGAGGEGQPECGAGVPALGALPAAARLQGPARHRAGAWALSPSLHRLTPQRGLGEGRGSTLTPSAHVRGINSEPKSTVRLTLTFIS
jgi:hypothetical protein